MDCPECGTKGYSKKTKYPEWRCRKCGHDLDRCRARSSKIILEYEGDFCLTMRISQLR